MSKEQTSDLFQKAKDQVAKKYGHDSWDSLLELSPSWEYDEVAKLYAFLQNAELLKELGDLVEDHYSGRIGNYGFASSVKQIVQKYTDKK